MIAKIGISNYYDMKNLPPETWTKMREVIPQWPEDQEHGFYGLNDLGIVDLDLCLGPLQAAGCEVKLLPFKGGMLVSLKDQISVLESKVEKYMHGEVVQITIPDLGIMYIDEVTVETDCCTDRLQTMLNDGWRMIAVCPPNAQRRPDYVLGRRREKR